MHFMVPRIYQIFFVMDVKDHQFLQHYHHRHYYILASRGRDVVARWRIKNPSHESKNGKKSPGKKYLIQLTSTAPFHM